MGCAVASSAPRVLISFLLYSLVATSQSAVLTAEAAPADSVVLSIEETTGGVGSEVVVRFRVGGFFAVSGLQGTVQWDPSVVQLIRAGDSGEDATRPMISEAAQIDFSGTSIPLMGPSNFNVISPGAMSMLWDEAFQPESGRSLDDGSVLFALHFTIVGEAGEASVVSIEDDPTPFKVAPAAGGDVPELAFAGRVAVQDRVLISGRVVSGLRPDRPVRNATVWLHSRGEILEMRTDRDGAYSFEVAPGAAVELTVTRPGNGNASRGVDVADIIDLRKHILSRARFGGPLRWLAGDVNRDDSVDVVDIVQMRKVILRRDDAFSRDTNGHKQGVWRFICASHTFADAENPFADLEDAGKCRFDNVISDISDVDFLSVKLGDSNGDWEDEAVAPAAADSDRTRGLRLMSAAGNGGGDPGADIVIGHVNLGEEEFVAEVPVSLNMNDLMLGVQFGIRWDPTVIEYSSARSDKLLAFDSGVHVAAGPGEARIIWDDPTLEGVRLEEGEAMIVLRFRRAGASGQGTDVVLSSGTLKPVVVGVSGKVDEINLRNGSVGVGDWMPGDGGRVDAVIGVTAGFNENGDFMLSVPTELGSRYRVESSDALDSDGWVELGVVEGTGEREPYVDQRPGAVSRFYRITRL